MCRGEVPRKTMEVYRLFAAIKPPAEIVKELARMQKGVPEARWSDPVKFHVTLGFFGDLDGEKAELLDQYLAEIHRPAFELTLSGTGHFGRSEPHSIWIGVEQNPALMRLHKLIRTAARACGLEMEKRDYRPHVTLAYFGRFADIAAIAKWEHLYSGYRSASFLVDEFLLQSSWRRQNGANRYETEAGYPLLG